MKPMQLIDGVIRFQPDPKAEKIKTAKANHAADIEAVQKGKLTDAEQRELLLRILTRLEALES